MKGRDAKRDERVWVAALTLANNIAVQDSDKYNANDESEACNACANTARRIRDWFDMPADERDDLISECCAEPSNVATTSRREDLDSLATENVKLAAEVFVLRNADRTGTRRQNRGQTMRTPAQAEASRRLKRQHAERATTLAILRQDRAVCLAFLGEIDDRISTLEVQMDGDDDVQPAYQRTLRDIALDVRALIAKIDGKAGTR